MGILDYRRPNTKLKLLNGERVNWIENNARRNYIRRCVLSFPPWVCVKSFSALKQKKEELENKTGVKHSLDHIIPLSHPRVCGLSVPENLRVIPHHINESKGNSWCEWHGDLFSEPEQLKLL